MKLSDAIRLGAMLRPVQAFYRLYDPGTGGSCALGAAAEAIGSGVFPDGYTVDAHARVPREWYVLRPTTMCPHCERSPAGAIQIDHVIVHLNNEHRWTREAIADWVEGLEQAAGVRADAGITDVDAARPSTSPGVDGGDRVQEFSVV